MQFSEPRVLVVSHNVFSASGNMGKTMMHMLAGISPDNLAQLYFHQEIPTRSCCLRYFRITDSNVLHALFTGQNIACSRRQISTSRPRRAEPTQAVWQKSINSPGGARL